MSINSFIQKVINRGPTQASLSIVMLVDGIYLSKVDEQDGVRTSFHEIEENNWEFALSSALKEMQCQDQSVTLTLGSHWYQSYQIDKPAIPQEEWPAALPFLLKDLITERATEIVADGVLLPGTNKVKAYVLSKFLIGLIKEVLAENNNTLLRILPEDEVWAKTRPDVPSFMLLHRSQNSDFKIGAYSEQSAVFQRTIRGINPPITGEDESTLQLDSLALELQRSMDYLASQLKQEQINKLFLCCDGEDFSQLQYALQERLNVTLEALLPLDISKSSGDILAEEALQLGIQGINLYPKFLQPKKELFTLDLVVFSWAVLLVLMLSIYSVYNYQNSKLSQQLTEVNQQVNQLTNELSVLNKKMKEHKASPAKLAAVERLKQEVKTKQDSLRVMGRFEEQDKVGFSGIMNGLASINRKDISLSAIYIEKGQMSIKGLAKSPEVIPSWVQQFKTEMNLIGRNFESLSIGRDENNVVTFSLYSTPKERIK